MELLTVPDVAEALNVPVTRVHQYVRDGELIEIRTADNKKVIPAGQILDGAIVKSLTAVITLLRDAKFTDDEIAEWLYRAEDSLPGTPIDALRENRGTEVKRRAQAAL